MENVQHILLSKKDMLIGTLPAYTSRPDDGKKHPGLILIHEIWGLVPHIKNVADRLAAEGYWVLAPDLFHNSPVEVGVPAALFEEMNNPETRDETQKKMRAFFAPLQSPEFAEKTVVALNTCVDHLLQEERVNGEVGVLGFCFGGTYSFHLAARDGRIRAAVSYYGQPPKPEEIPHFHIPVLAFYGDQDANLMQSLPQLIEDMKKNGKEFEAIVYPNAGHAFFNDMNTRMYNKDAAQNSWEKTLSYLSKALPH